MARRRSTKETAVRRVIAQNVSVDNTPAQWTIPALLDKKKKHAFVIANNDKKVLKKILKIAEEVYVDLCPAYLEALKKFCSMLPGASVEKFKKIKRNFELSIRRILFNSPQSLAFDLNNANHVDLIGKLAYQIAIPNPAVLNSHYESFSSEVYGETNFCQMDGFIEELKPTDEDVFVDLGSGVGQVVSYVAGLNKVSKCIGIELLKVPATFAPLQAEVFEKLMAFFGKSHTKMEYHHNDMLSEKMKRLVRDEATIIYLNNLAFRDDFNQRIVTELLQDLKHGTKIIHSKPLSIIRKDGTQRRLLGDIAAISTSEKLEGKLGGVSWTGKKIPFFLTTIDHNVYANYLVEEEQKKLRREQQAKEKKEAAAKRKITKEANKENSDATVKKSNSNMGKSCRQKHRR